MNNFGQSISDWYGRIGIYGFWKEAHTRHINPQLCHFYDGQEAFIKQMQIFNLNFMNAPVKLLLLQSYSHNYQPVLIVLLSWIIFQSGVMAHDSWVLWLKL